MIYSKFDLDMFRDVNQISLILEILLFTDRRSNMNLAKKTMNGKLSQGTQKKLGITSSSMMLSSISGTRLLPTISQAVQHGSACSTPGLSSSEEAK